MTSSVRGELDDRALEAARPAINLGTFVTVGSVRRYAMGDANRAPTAAELDTMAGWLGLSGVEVVPHGDLGPTLALASAGRPTIGVASGARS